jgi:PAS domain S-box-containing protein
MSKRGKEKKWDYRISVLYLTLLACVILSFYFAFADETIVYTHLFYIPILLAGIWYERKAIYVAFFLGAIHISTTYYFVGPLLIETFGRASIFIAVAYIIGLVSSKRAKAEAVVIEERDKFLRMLDTIEETVFVIDRDLRILDLSKGCLNKIRNDIEWGVAIGKRCYDGLWGLEEVCEGCLVSSVFEKGEVARTERVFSLSDGTNRYFDIEWIPVFDEHGEVIRVIGDIREITHRKEAEEKLTKIVDGVNIPAFAINSEHKITHWNTAVESLTELKRESVIGTDKQWLPFYPEKRPVMADLIVDKAQESEIKARYGDKYKKSSLIEGAYEALDFFPTLGEEGKWLLFTAAPLRGSNGDVVGAIETLQDLTERKNAEEQSRTIFEHVRTPLCLIEEEKRIYSINKEFETLSGYSREEAVGKKWTEFVAPEDLERVTKYSSKGEKDVTPCCDFKFVDREGNMRDVKVCIVPIPGGKIKVASLMDLTTLKREKELSAICEELKELDDMKKNFLNAAYHELRSPLTPIVGYASLLKCDELADKQKDYVSNIEKYADQLKEQINRMLELASIDGGEVVMTLEDVSIPEIVDGVVKSVKPLLNEKGQTITTHVPAGIEVRGDRLKIIGILNNLISNAIKYTSGSGRIDIMVEDRGGDIRVSVADTGIGIPEKHLPKVFERFFMVNTSLTRKSESLGLGLSIVKEYVKLHGGHIWATSEPEKGSKFFFTLPKKKK